VRDDLLWYFAYGSNMSPGTFLDRRKMQPVAVRPGYVDGYRLYFDIPVGPGERGVANLMLDPTARTHGVTYSLTPDDAERLDRTEGVPAGVYYREAVSTTLADGASVSAFTYRSTRTSAGRKPSARYIGILLDGARTHGLPDDYVRWLEAWELAVDERLAVGER